MKPNKATKDLAPMQVTSDATKINALNNVPMSTKSTAVNSMNSFKRSAQTGRKEPAILSDQKRVAYNPKKK